MAKKRKKLELYELPEPEVSVTPDLVRAIAGEQLRNIRQPITIQEGYIKSANFVKGSTGYQFKPDGGSVSSVSISAIPNNTNTDISLLEATHNLVFSVTDADTIAWTSGTINLSNGRTFTIDAGNTGNMAALTYIYLDTGVSSTVLQTTTTYSTAMGANKLLIGVAQNQTTTASYIPFTGGGKPLLDGEQLGALSVGSAVIANLAVTNAKINDLAVSKLTAGTITSKSVVLAVSDGTGDVEMRAGIATGDFDNSGAASGFIFGIDDSDGDKTKFYWGNATRNVKFDGTDLTVNGYLLSGKGAFGGNGADGALTITSGTTTVSAASAGIFFKNYTSISITGTGVLAFSNPHANGTIGIIKSQGAVTTTSSATPAFDGRSMGAAGAATNTLDAAGSNGNDNGDILDTSNHFGAGGGHFVDSVSAGVGGAAGAALDTTSITNLAFPYTTATTYLYRQRVHLQCGSGAGSGAGDGGGDEGGSGGRGGGGFLIECAGAWNFTTTNGISVAGITGGNSVNGDSGTPGNGGGGGGGAGQFVALYNSLTANTGTVNIAGGNGGTGSNSLSGSQYANAGGGGGAGVVSAGGAGGAGGAPNNNGVDGSDGSGASGGTGGAKGTSDGSSSGGGGGGGGGGMGSSLIAENLYYA